MLWACFDFRSDEPLVEAGIRAQASAITAESVHGLRAVVDGRDITLQGLADSEAEKTTMLNALRKIEGRAKLRSQVDVLEAITPYQTTARLTDDGQITFRGAVPSERIRRSLGHDYGEGVAALVLASGAPDGHWPEVANAGLRALSQLHHGELVIEDRALRLAGDALTPDVKARALLLLEDLPSGYEMAPMITVLDDGTPLRLTAARNDGGMVSLSGKLPRELADQLARSESTEIATSLLPVPFEGWGQGVVEGVHALDHLHSGHLAVIGRGLTLTGDAWSQDDYEAVTAAVDALPPQMQVSADITLADSGAPFGLEMELANGVAKASGKVPRSLSAPVLSALVGAPLEAPDLEIARISPAQSWWDAASIGAEGLRRTQSGAMRFDGSTLALTAVVQDPRAADALSTHLSNLPDGVELALDVTLIDDGTPLRLSLSFDGKAAQISGKVPVSLTTRMLSEALGAKVVAGDLITTPNAPPLNWQAAAITGAQVLTLFARGTLEITGDDLLLSGTVLNPAREREVMAMLETLPAGYNAATELTFQDDGRPFAFRLDFDGRRAILSGKTPSDLGPASQAAILGFPVMAEAFDFAAVTADTEWWVAARASLKALSLLSEGTLTIDAHQISLTGMVTDKDTADAIAQQLIPIKETFKLNLDIGTP